MVPAPETGSQPSHSLGPWRVRLGAFRGSDRSQASEFTRSDRYAGEPRVTRRYSPGVTISERIGRLAAGGARIPVT
jgi:hypothetical protein